MLHNNCSFEVSVSRQFNWQSETRCHNCLHVYFSCIRSQQPTPEPGLLSDLDQWPLKNCLVFSFRSKCCFLCCSTTQHCRLKLIIYNNQQLCTHYYCKLLPTSTGCRYIQQSFIDSALTWLTEASLWPHPWYNTSFNTFHSQKKTLEFFSDLTLYREFPLLQKCSCILSKLNTRGIILYFQQMNPLIINKT